jgi:UDP-N-acetylmuramoyl-tripeptide--D-alanyl-D-alanine ligase
LKLEKAAEMMGGDATNIDPALRSAQVDSFVIDSREAQAGDVFFALSQPEYRDNCFNGEFDDSTKYVAAALRQGAIAAVVRRDRFAEHEAALAPFRDRLIFADDVIVAFQKLAHGVFIEWGKSVVAITGSAGKTTAKELTAHVLSASGLKVLRNIKNYNNGLGLPITVLNLAKDQSYDVAVLEMGMSTPNREIARLCEIAQPTVAIELNVLPVHIEHLGTIEGVQRAKAELVEGMKDGGTAILNADDPRVLAMRNLSKGKTLTYGIDNPADVMAKNIRFDRFGETRFTLVTPDSEAEAAFPLNGKHNIMSALAASAAGVAFGMDAAAIAASLVSVEPPPQRGEVLHFAEGFTVVNDTYNSNPDALLSMTRTIVDGGGGAKRRIVVAGEMRELGENSRQIHFETGAKIATVGIDKLYGVEGYAAEMVRGAESAGLTATGFYENSTVAGDKFVREVEAGDLILVKGSRGVRTERVIEKLLEKFTLSNN